MTMMDVVNIDETQLLKTLLASDWTGVTAMISQGLPDSLAYVVFTTRDVEIGVTGKVHSLLTEPEEVFGLQLYIHTEEHRQRERKFDPTFWKMRDLAAEWTSASLGAILRHPREARFYSDPRFKRRKYPAKEVLDNCTAIEFLKSSGGSDVRKIVLAASEDYPSDINMGTTPAECDVLLDGLEPMTVNLA
jgi:hypothetical protein